MRRERETEKKEQIDTCGVDIYKYFRVWNINFDTCRLV